jgi:hypothetical protein
MARVDDEVALFLVVLLVNSSVLTIRRWSGASMETYKSGMTVVATERVVAVAGCGCRASGQGKLWR